MGCKKKFNTVECILKKDLHRDSPGYAVLCEVRHESPGGYAGVERHVEAEQLAVAVGLKLKDLAAHNRLGANVLLWHRGRRTCKNRSCFLISIILHSGEYW